MRVPGSGRAGELSPISTPGLRRSCRRGQPFVMPPAATPPRWPAVQASFSTLWRRRAPLGTAPSTLWLGVKPTPHFPPCDRTCRGLARRELSGRPGIPGRRTGCRSSWRCLPGLGTVPGSPPGEPSLARYSRRDTGRRLPFPVLRRRSEESGGQDHAARCSRKAGLVGRRSRSFPLQGQSGCPPTAGRPSTATFPLASLRCESGFGSVGGNQWFAVSPCGPASQAANPTEVTYSYFPHCDPRLTIWSIQASSRARASPLAHASTMASQLRMFSLRYSRTR